MALNITLAGKVFSCDGVTPIDCSYQVLFYNSVSLLKDWSEIRQTELTDYNINLGDPDLSGQDNTLNVTNSSNEWCLLKFWVGSDPLPSQFAFILVNLSGQNVYVNNVKLCPPSQPSCPFSLAETAAKGSLVTSTSLGTPNNSYDWNGLTHYQFTSYWNTSIFPNLSITSREWDWGDGYTTNNFHSFDSNDIFSVSHRVTNSYGMTSECQRSITIVNDIVPCFDFTPVYPKIGEIITVTPCITGNVESIIDVDWYFDGRLVFSGDYNTTFTFQIDSWVESNLTQIVNYNDGFTDKTESVSKQIVLDALPPEVAITAESLGDSEWLFTQSSFSPNGTITEVRWEIFLHVHDLGSDDFTLSKVYDSGLVPPNPSISLLLEQSGDYTAKITVWDTTGGSASATTPFSQICGTSVCESVAIDWDSKIVKVPFSIITKKSTFEVINKNITFDIKEEKLSFSLKTRKLEFSMREHRMEFEVSNPTL